MLRVLGDVMTRLCRYQSDSCCQWNDVKVRGHTDIHVLWEHIVCVRIVKEICCANQCEWYGDVYPISQETCKNDRHGEFPPKQNSKFYDKDAIPYLNRSNHIQSAFYFVEQENTFAETDSFNNTTSHLLENNRRKHYTRSHHQRTEQTDNEIAPRIEMPYFKFHVRCSHAPRNVQEIHKGDRVDEILGLLPSLPCCYGQP